MTKDWPISRWREEFPLLANKTYLNSGAYGAMARSVRTALDQYAEERMTLGENWGGWMGRQERVRTLLAALLDVGTAELAITTSVSASLNSLASALDFSGRRRKIVLSPLEFPTSGQVWQAQRRRGAEVVYAEEDASGSATLESFESLIDDETLIVGITHVCYRNSVKLDVPAIVKLAHSRGALVVLDAYQTVGSENLRPRELDVDFAVGGTLKYLLGSAGLGFLYVRESLIDQLVPVNTGWLAQANIGAMDIRRNDPAPDARRFESGAPPVPSCFATEAGLEIVTQIGLVAIERHIRALVALATAQLTEAGIKLATPADPARRGALVAIRARDDAALVQKLREKDVVASCRAGNLRTSFHFYNNEQDVNDLLAALCANRALLA